MQRYIFFEKTKQGTKIIYVCEVMTSDSSIKISIPNKKICTSINVPISKSEAGRLLVLQALSDGRIKLQNTSSANDAKIIERALVNNEKEINIEDAGTAMRFLTAYFCAKNEHKILRGTERMYERPIGELVNALREIGFDIRYLNNENFPPLEIVPINLETLKNETEINGTISSQFISALMMIGAFLQKGLTIKIKDGKTISEAYIKLTASLMKECGIEPEFSENKIVIKSQNVQPISVSAGGDWTNVSYWYAFAALSESAEITIENLKKETAQGDIAIVEIGKVFGVETIFESNKITLKKEASFRVQRSGIEESPKHFGDFSTRISADATMLNRNDELSFNFSNNPDLAQTIIVLCAGLNREATFTGLQSLRIKETDRIVALQEELKKIGFELQETEANTFALKGKFHAPILPIKTYNDHRMAMAFAPLSLLAEIEIEEPNVVRKSYPEFWNEVAKLY
ncbi:MAG TPA: hypothetical protein VGB95_06610 [Chitinophagales bacterium]